VRPVVDRFAHGARVAWSTGLRPTTATGARIAAADARRGDARGRRPSRSRSVASRRSAPARWQEIDSQTRTVSGGGGASPSFTMSKWW
jgi:hypothetical protein